MLSYLFLTLALSAQAISQVNSRAVLREGKDVNAIEGEYIVVLHGNTSTETKEKHLNIVSQMSDGDETPTILHVYHIGSFKGYAVKTSKMLLETVQEMPEVKYIEQNQRVHLDCINQDGATWGLVRTSERKLDLNQPYQYLEDDGSDVDAYIIDTGIFVGHDEFNNNRARPGADFVGETCPSYQAGTEGCDGNGHGTHVAGTIVGNTYGIAKQGTAIAVKVLNSYGSGSWNDIIAGIDWVASAHQKSNKKSVANMSLGGATMESVNDAVDSAVTAGVVFCVSAGNDNYEACRKSPASAEKAITVGSTTDKDERSSFSNYGECVTIFAPGSLVTSAWIGSESATNTISGTSMAAPHAAGVAAKYLSRHPTASPDDVRNALVNSATENEIEGLPSDTVNKLLFMNCD